MLPSSSGSDSRFSTYKQQFNSAWEYQKYRDVAQSVALSLWERAVVGAEPTIPTIEFLVNGSQQSGGRVSLARKFWWVELPRDPPIFKLYQVGREVMHNSHKVDKNGALPLPDTKFHAPVA